MNLPQNTWENFYYVLTKLQHNPAQSCNILMDNVVKNQDQPNIFISTRKSVQHCPFYGCETKCGHDYRIQKIKDLSLYGKECYLLLRKRRYIRKHCDKKFYEKYDFYRNMHIAVKEFIYRSSMR